MIDALTASPVAWATARALVAFVWQGAVIGAVTAIALVLLRRRTARLRYLIACTGLAALCAAPVATGFLLFDPDRAIVQRAGPAAVRDHVGPVAPTDDAGSIDPSSQSSVPAILASAAEWLNTRLPALLLVWAAGVSVLALRLARGWINVVQIRREARPLGEHPIAASAVRIARRLGVRRSVRLLSSARVLVPAVIGWIRPAILLPAAVVAGMPAAHLDAILAHELAHIRRSDFLVNVLQSAAEVLLFYHPAVWWVSRQIRVERELCADDLAVAVSRRPRHIRRRAHVTRITARRASRDRHGLGRRLADTRAGGCSIPTSPQRPRISGGFAMTVAMMLLLFAFTGTRPALLPRSPGHHLPRATAPIAKPAAGVISSAKFTPDPDYPRHERCEGRSLCRRRADAGDWCRARQRWWCPSWRRRHDQRPRQGSQLLNPEANRTVTDARGSFSFPEVPARRVRADGLPSWISHEPDQAERRRRAISIRRHHPRDWFAE